MALRFGVSLVSAGAMALGILVAPGVASPAAATCGTLASSYKATVEGSISNHWGVYGDAVTVYGTGSASVKGTANLTGSGGDYYGDFRGNAALAYDETSGSPIDNRMQRFTGTANRTLPDTSPSSAYMLLGVNPTTCAFRLYVASRLQSNFTMVGGNNPGTSTGMWDAMQVTVGGTLVPGGITTGTATLPAYPNDVCSPDWGNNSHICKFYGRGFGPGLYPEGGATGSLKYTIAPPEPTVTLTSVVPQHQADGATAWTVVTEKGAYEGEPLRLLTRLNSDRPLAAKLKITEVGGAGLSRTTANWLVTDGAPEAWGSVLQLPAIPRSVGTVERTFRASIIYCPTTSGCTAPALKETPSQLVKIVFHPALTILSAHYETQSSSTSPWRRVPLLEGVWRGDPLRLVFSVKNASTTKRAFGFQLTEVPASTRPPYYSSWHTIDPGETDVTVDVRPTTRTDVYLRTLLAQLYFCPTATVCEWAQRRLTFNSGATYTESPRLQIIPRSLAYRVLGGVVTRIIPAGATSAQTGLPESSESTWTVRVVNEGPALYHRLFVRYVGEGLLLGLPGRLTSSGPLGLDFTVPVQGGPHHSGRPIASRTFDFIAKVCPSTTPCATSQIRTVTRRITIGTQPLVVMAPDRVAYRMGGNPVWADISDSQPVYMGIGESKQLWLEFDTTAVAGPARYRIHVRELTPGVSVKDYWSAASSTTDFKRAPLSVPVNGITGGNSLRTFDTWVEYCPSLNQPTCAPEETVSTVPKRVVLRVIPNK